MSLERRFLHHKIWSLLPSGASRLHRIIQTGGQESASSNYGSLEEHAAVENVLLGGLFMIGDLCDSILCLVLVAHTENWPECEA